ncbi:MAG TPA: hypothetical protein VMA36_13890 [Candidatus Limnocylindria bacterium]|jgi:hypothetical protein|nr:hypothetical protein [Candidatus Limnocylindria bacterium]
MMKRVGFLGGLAATLGAGSIGARAAGISTVLLLAATDPSLDDAFTNEFAEVLRERGVNVVDPSSVHVTYHQRSTLVAAVFGPVLAVAANSVGWIETQYHSRRALFATVDLHRNSLPYGEFTVHQVRATCSFRCMDVLSREIVKAGIGHGEERGEDLADVSERAGSLAIRQAAATAAAALRD